MSRFRIGPGYARRNSCRLAGNSHESTHNRTIPGSNFRHNHRHRPTEADLMGRDLAREIQKLKRKQKDIAAAIAFYESLEGQSEMRDKPAKKAGKPKSRTFMKRQARLKKS